MSKQSKLNTLILILFVIGLGFCALIIYLDKNSVPDQPLPPIAFYQLNEIYISDCRTENINFAKHLI